MRQQLLLAVIVGAVGIFGALGWVIWRQESGAISLPSTFVFSDDGVSHTPSLNKPVQAEVVKDRLVLKFKPNTVESRQSSIAGSNNLTLRKSIGGLGIHVFTPPAGSDVTALAKALAALPEVEFAEPDTSVPQTEFTPNDLWFSYFSPYATRMQLPKAWEKGSGSAVPTIAVVDDGVRASHEDLIGQVIPGWNSISNSTDTSPLDGSSHGTLVAGAAAALGNNQKGVVGVCGQCRILPIRVAHTPKLAYTSEIADGVRYAAENGARIIVAGYRLDVSSKALNNVLDYARSKNSLVITGAGNDTSRLPLADQPNLLVVGGTDAEDSKVTFSNWGDFIDLVAPYYGYAPTAESDSNYRGWAGTSASAPYVAGVAGLVLSSNPNLTATQLEQVLFNSAKDLGEKGRDPLYGWGIVNAEKALELATP